MYHKLIFFYAVCLALFTPISVNAQACEQHFETITDMTFPRFGYPSVWDAKYGEKEEFTTLGSVVTSADDNTVIAVGQRLDPADMAVKSVFIAQINHRGRALWHKDLKTGPSEIPVKLIEAANGYVLVSAIKGGKNGERDMTRIAWLTSEGALRFDRILDSSHFDYKPVTALAAAEGGGFVVAVQAVANDGSAASHAVLVRFNAAGDRLWTRSYLTGLPNYFNDIIKMGDDAYLAVGKLKQEDGRMGAWLVKLTQDGIVSWQHTYPRGAESAFYGVDIVPPVTGNAPQIVVSGMSVPLDGAPQAAMAMKLDALGTVEWLRYFRRSDFAMNARWVVHQDDSRLLLVVDAQAIQSNPRTQDHIRMITLSERGNILSEEAYMAGRGTRVTDFVQGAGNERIAVASIIDVPQGTEEVDIKPQVIGLTPYDPEGERDAAGKGQGSSAVTDIQEEMRGWVLVAPALGDYTNPCR